MTDTTTEPETTTGPDPGDLLELPTGCPLGPWTSPVRDALDDRRTSTRSH